MTDKAIIQSFPKVYIIILNYNGRDVLKNCLSSIFAINYPNWEVILVDNNSQDGSFEAAKKDFSRAIFIKNSANLGYSAGNNVGIRFALEKMADYVLLLNFDTEVEKDFLSRMIEVGEKDKKAGILSPLIFKGKAKKIWFSGGRIDWLRMKTIHKQRHAKQLKRESYPTEFISGCSMLVKKEVFGKIGLLDEDFFLYWEDADFCCRAKRAGFGRKIVPGSVIYHYEKSEEEKANKVYWLVISGLIFFKKNSPFWLRPWLLLYVFFRKLKNKANIRMKNNQEVAASVKKAYADFKQAKAH